MWAERASFSGEPIHYELSVTHSGGGVAQADGCMNPARAGATV